MFLTSDIARSKSSIMEFQMINISLSFLIFRFFLLFTIFILEFIWIMKLSYFRATYDAGKLNKSISFYSFPFKLVIWIISCSLEEKSKLQRKKIYPPHYYKLIIYLLYIKMLQKMRCHKINSGDFHRFKAPLYKIFIFKSFKSKSFIF